MLGNSYLNDIVIFPKVTAEECTSEVWLASTLRVHLILHDCNEHWSVTKIEYNSAMFNNWDTITSTRYLCLWYETDRDSFTVHICLVCWCLSRLQGNHDIIARLFEGWIVILWFNNKTIEGVMRWKNNATGHVGILHGEIEQWIACLHQQILHKVRLYVKDYKIALHEVVFK